MHCDYVMHYSSASVGMEDSLVPEGSGNQTTCKRESSRVRNTEKGGEDEIYVELI